MKKNNLTQKDWLEYLNNLNNREINKKNASGFKLWALFGLFGFTFFKLLDSLPIIFANINNIFLTILFFTNIFNFFIVAAMFTTTLLFPLSRKRKIITKLSDKSSVLVSVMVNFIILIGVICNIYVVIFSKNYGLSTIPYYFFGINGAVNIFGKMTLKKIIDTKDSKMPKIDYGLYHSTKYKNPIKYINGFFCLILFCLLIWSIYQIIQNNYILNHLDLIKSSFYISILIATVHLFIYQLIWSMKFEWLEQFERKIILKNFSEKEIVKEFIEEFAGKDVIQWLKEIEDETKEETKRSKKLYNKLEREFSILEKEEKDLNKRVIKAKKILKSFKLLSNSTNTLKSKFINNNDKLKHFLKQGPISDEEYLLITTVVNARTKETKKILDMISKIKIKIKEFEEYINTTEKLITEKSNNI